MKHLIGYFIRRSAKDPHAFRGKTICAYPHTIFTTSGHAFEALRQARLDDALDPRFDHDVTEAWMHVEDER